MTPTIRANYTMITLMTGEELMHWLTMHIELQRLYDLCISYNEDGSARIEIEEKPQVAESDKNC